jgi:hypothetical protein
VQREQGRDGPDRKPYRVDSYVVLSTASTNPPTPANGRALRIVTVVVRDGKNLNGRPLARLAATFDSTAGDCRRASGASWLAS